MISIRVVVFLLCIVLSLPVLGQLDATKKVVDSLSIELRKSSAILRNKKEEVERLRYLLTAKEMALRSVELTDSAYQALVAIQAHNFWVRGNGSYDDFEIYRGLYKALMTFNDPLFDELPERVNKMGNAEYTKTTVMADRLCLRVSRNMLVEEWDRFASHFPYEKTCPTKK